MTTAPKKFNVLYVEDDLVDYKIIERTIRNEGFLADITHAYTHHKIDEYYRSGWPFDLVLLDNWLPGTNAIELLQKLKAYEIDSPVIIITSYINDDFARKALSFGAKAIIYKDNLQNFIQVVEKYIPRHQEHPFKEAVGGRL